MVPEPVHQAHSLPLAACRLTVPRRAKLKRLTSDDRERILKSRALPDDFDMTQTLQSTYTDFPPSASGQFPSPGSYYQAKHSAPATPAFTGNLRPYSDEYTLSPLSPSSMWDSYFSPHLNTTPKDSMPAPGHMPEPAYITSNCYPSLSRSVWNGPPLPLRFGDNVGQARTTSLASSSHSNEPIASDPLHHAATPLRIELPKSNDQDFNGTTSSANFLHDNKVDDVNCEKSGERN